MNIAKWMDSRYELFKRYQQTNQEFYFFFLKAEKKCKNKRMINASRIYLEKNGKWKQSEWKDTRKVNGKKISMKKKDKKHSMVKK